MSRAYGATLLLTLLTQATYAGVKVLASYRVLELGGGLPLIGILTAAFALVPLLLTIPTGRFLDRRRAVTVLAAGVVLSATAPALIVSRASLGMLAIGFIILGFAQMLTTIAGQGLVTAISRPEQLDRRFGGWTLAVSLGQSVSLPLVGFLVTFDGSGDRYETATALIAMTVLSALAIPFAFSKAAFDVPGGLRELASDRRSVPVLLKAKGMKPAVFSSMMVLVSLDILAAYLPALGQQYGFSAVTVTTLLTVRTVAAVISRALLPMILRWSERRTLLVAASLVSAPAMAAVPFASDPVLIGTLLGIAGFLWGFGQPLTMTWVVGVAGPSNRAAGLSVRLTANRLGQVAIPAAAGLVSGVVGVGAVFVTTAVLLGAAGVFTWSSLSARHQS